MRRKKNVRAAEILLAAATVLLAALLIGQCVGLYWAGTAASNRTETGVLMEPVFSRELVGGRLYEIAWAFVLWGTALAAAVVGRIRRPSPGAEQVLPGVRERLTLACRWKERTDQMRREERKRRIAGGVCAAVCAVCAAGAGAYFVRPSSFASQDLEWTMGRMMLNVAPWAAAALAACWMLMVFEEKSMGRELDMTKAAPKRTPEGPAERSGHTGNILCVALYAAAVLLIAAGVMNGGMRDVLVKAINICTECIGLG